MKSDIEIAQETLPRPIADIADAAGLLADELDLYGPYKAKVRQAALDRLADRPDGRLVIVTAITPTVAGEGKTTVTVGLGQALCAIGKQAVVTLREPAMGPVFGVKGGAAGGGYSQVIPMEDINLHFTGDFHAITAANNLLAALIDNHLQQGNSLGIDSRRLTWRRCLDVNDRSLRAIITGLGGSTEGVPRETGFDITPASEIMAIFCLAENLVDLTERLGRVVVGFTRAGVPIRAADLNAQGALTVLLKDALNPNLVQTLEGGPALIHGGPFANIAHGTNTIRATRLARKLGEYALVETGFGADLGFEKFCDIVARQTGVRPDAALVIASTRALKLHGGVDKNDLKTENVEAVRRGMPNLFRHVENVGRFGLPALVAINMFDNDTEPELQAIEEMLASTGIAAARCDIHARGGAGGKVLAERLVELLDRAPAGEFHVLYPDEMPLKQKIETVATQIYRASGVDFVGTAPRDLALFEKLGYGHLPVCIAKTQYSFSDNAALLNAPDNFRVAVRSARLSAGAGFVVALTGEIMTMPGLGKVPAAERISVAADGRVAGLS